MRYLKLYGLDMRFFNDLGVRTEGTSENSKKQSVRQRRCNLWNCDWYNT